MWICLEIEDCARRTKSFWGSLCLGARAFFNPPLPWQGNHYPPSVTFLFSQRSTALEFSPVHLEIHLPTPVYSYLSHIRPNILSIFTLKAPYCIYIYYDYTRFFFYCECFCAAPVLFDSLLVALMWNVCAEPIECCVYIKATLFLTIPVFIVCVRLKSCLIKWVIAAHQFKNTLTWPHLCRKLR